MVKSNRQIIGLACISDNGTYSKPVSLLNMRINSPIKNSKLIKYSVIDIQVKSINDLKK